ncbi:GerAB/ArcD/ProY family transporter [Lederbergia citrea]|uniref:GerAB/ArcD/ProY family transporter n=1 Tax=Lederbergia citrea TaxID=2833581 RepID=A0A942UR31_9BACI|nr:GerAB/ArcD/ProY family transporter [Lederbergia citrea]MBS4178942.1 GerAB/ArcD/ProY family transporter [Lederbergia citrea]MBS4205623.1 GerAB/ArcD/ProY family transporter [Lederbergia citrea]MBS4224042.1 GerAB/ArcD/ProY family transporter [Lederbergia citrea]
MIKTADGKIGTREFFSIIILDIGIKATDTTPNFLFTDGKNAAWMMPIFSFVIILIPFLLLLSLLKKHEKGLMELLFNLTGKYIGGIIGFGLFLIVFSGTFINSRSYIDIVNVMFYPKAPVLLLLFLLLGVASFLVAKRGFEAIGRTAWFLIPTIHIMLILLIILSWKELDWVRLFPIAGPGVTHIMKKSITHSSLYGDIILFAVFFSFIRNYKSFRLASFLGLGFSCAIIAVFLAIYTMVFDYPEIINMAYPYQQLTRIASLGEIITHVEAIFLGIWVISAAIHFAITLYLSAYLFAGALQLTEFEPLILPFAGLALLLGLHEENIFQVTTLREILFISSSWIFILLPFFLWTVDRWKGRVKE